MSYDKYLPKIEKIFEESFKRLKWQIIPEVYQNHQPHFYDMIYEILDHMVKGGKKWRAHTMMQTAFIILAEKQGPERAMALMKDAAIIGWCMETQFAYHLMQDDIVDQSTMRRGKPCWYTLVCLFLVAVFK